MMKVTGKEAMMNKAASEMPKSGHKAPAPASGPGPSAKPDMEGALMGNPTDKNPLHAAMAHVHADHSEKAGSHIRHEPLHGLKRR